ncbi:MAG: transketolase C-terminal domain-containing protein, partial [Cyclobacteriaceae bacterium]
GMMRMLPNMTVIVPCDYMQTKQATMALGDHVGPTYLRFGRPKWPIFIKESDEFVIGKAQKLIEGNDVTIFANGHMVWQAILAEEILSEKGISVEVINIHTVKPLDVEAVIASASKTGAVVTAEEHQINGGLGDLIAHTLVKNMCVPQEFVAVEDHFGESGTPDQLLEKYGLTPDNIVSKVEKVLGRKGK